MGSPSEPYTVRQADIDRIDHTVRDTAGEITKLSSKLSDIRVLLAEGYVSKGDHERALAAKQKENDEALENLTNIIHDHSESDDKRFTELRHLLYGLIGGVLVLLGTTVGQLIVTLAQLNKGK